MKNVLVIFEEHPENTFLVPLEVTEEQACDLLKCHGFFVNNSETPTFVGDFIMKFFYDEAGEFKFEKTCNVQSGHFDHVIVTGFIL